MLSPEDPEFFKTLSERCLELCKNNPSLITNYKDVSNAFSQSLDIFLNQYNKRCLDSVTAFETERARFANVTREIEFQHYMTEMLVERSERFKMGAKTTQTRFDNYQHYLEAKTKTTPLQKHRYNFRVNDVVALTNVNELSKGKLHQNPKALFMDVSTVKEIPFEHTRQYITAASMQNRVFIAGTASSFWACINPTLGDAKIDYSCPDCNLDFTKLNEFQTNTESMKKFPEKSIYNQDVINDIITKSKQVEPAAQNKAAKRADPIVFSASSPQSTQASPNDVLASGSEPKSSISNNNSSFDENASEDIAPPPDSDDDQPPPFLYKATALFPYQAQSSAELGFEKDAVIDIIEQHDNGWLVGSLNGAQGYVPQNYVQRI